MKWSWLWRLHDAIRGPLPGIVIEGELIDCAGIAFASIAKALPGSALAETNGLRAWILDEAALGALRTNLQNSGGQVLTRPRVQTAHGIQASLSVGASHPLIPVSLVGVTLDLLPLIQADGTELTSSLTMTAAVTNDASGAGAKGVADPQGAGVISLITNLATAARWRFRDGTGVFMLAADGSNDAPRLGVIVSAKVKR